MREGPNLKSNTNLLILGKTGFVGQNAEQYFSTKNQFVVKSLSRKDVDLEEKKSLQLFLETNQIDIILNCAGYVGGIHKNINEPYELITRNLNVSLNIISMCVEKKIKLINFGSSCMYPTSAQMPLNVSSLNEGKLDETSKYFARSKLTTQAILEAAKAELGMDWVTVIPATIYGPHDNFSAKDGHVIPSLIRKFHVAKTGSDKTVKLFGSGNTKREFIFITDFLEALYLVMVLNLNHKVINIGTSHEVRILELAQKLSNIFKFPGQIVTDESLPDGNTRRLLDSSEIYSLGWKPKIDLDLGLDSTVNWFRSSLLE